MTGWQAMGCGGLVGCEFVSLKMNMALGKEVHPTLTAVSKILQVLKLKKNHPLGLSNFQPNWPVGWATGTKSSLLRAQRGWNGASAEARRNQAFACAGMNCRWAKQSRHLDFPWNSDGFCMFLKVEGLKLQLSYWSSEHDLAERLRFLIPPICLLAKKRTTRMGLPTLWVEIKQLMWRWLNNSAELKSTAE